MDYIIGVDVGTTSTKAVIYTLHGDIKGYSNQLTHFIKIPQILLKKIQMKFLTQLLKH